MIVLLLQHHVKQSTIYFLFIYTAVGKMDCLDCTNDLKKFSTTCHFIRSKKTYSLLKWKAKKESIVLIDLNRLNIDMLRSISIL